MTRLPIVFSFFLSASVTLLVALLSLLTQASPGTLLTRCFTVFFLFGLVGAVFGVVLEILLMPAATEMESEKLHQEMKLDHPDIVRDLGDLPSINPADQAILPLAEPGAKDTVGLEPVVVPRMTVEQGNVVSRGESAVVS